MDHVTILGYIAGTLTTVAFIPQVVHTWKLKSAKDISLAMFGSFCTGVVLWLIYGFLIQSPPIILTNIVTLALAGTILVFKIRFK